jgi:hypothetical protein
MQGDERVEDEAFNSSRKRAGKAVGQLKPSNLIDRLRSSINIGYS